MIRFREIMKHAKTTLMLTPFLICIFTLAACGNTQSGLQDTSTQQEGVSQTENDVFSEVIKGLKDGEAYAFADIGLEKQVLLVAPSIYTDNSGNKLATISDVYYEADGILKNAGTVKSMGTAYPIAYDEAGVYTGSNSERQRFSIDVNTGTLQLQESVKVSYDNNGNAVYTREENGNTENISEAEYIKLTDKYNKATVANFKSAEK